MKKLSFRDYYFLTESTQDKFQAGDLVSFGNNKGIVIGVAGEPYKDKFVGQDVQEIRIVPSTAKNYMNLIKALAAGKDMSELIDFIQGQTAKPDYQLKKISNSYEMAKTGQGEKLIQLAGINTNQSTSPSNKSGNNKLFSLNMDGDKMVFTPVQN